MQTNKDGQLKQFKQFGLFSLISLLLTSTLAAQSFENFKRTQNNSFTKYRDAKDVAFDNYLKAPWQEYTGKESKPLYERQKPKSITPTLEKKIKSVGPSVNIKIQKIAPKPIPKPIEKIPVIIVEENSKDINFLFFGQKIGLNIDEKFRDAKFYPQNQAGIANFFSLLASSDYEGTIREIKTIAKDLILNDWGIYLLVNSLSESLFLNADDRKLFSWFILNKLGYEVKVGLGGKHIVLMHYSEKTIYSTPNYSFDKKKFYVISDYAKKSSSHRVYTYPQSYPEANKPLNLELDTLPNFEKNIQSKTVSFEEFGVEYKASYRYDRNLIDFMATYPQANYGTYFNSPMSKETYEDIAKDLKKYIDTKKASVGINFVLHFVQKAFKYERDQVQFGREKVMFANETLYYNSSDCEDRAILFSSLVEKLFGIGVVGVKYKDHMDTALYIPISGDSVKVDGKKYVVADPTYVNANIGQSMPQYKSKMPERFIIVKKLKSND